jgi:hypothetical protein
VLLQHEASSRNHFRPTIDRQIAAVALALPAFLVTVEGAWVRAEQHTAGHEHAAQLRQHTGQQRKRHVEQRRVRKHAIELSIAQRQLKEVLVQHLAASVLPCVISERLAAVESSRRLAQRTERTQVAPGATTKVENAQPAPPIQCIEQRRVVL